MVEHANAPFEFVQNEGLGIRLKLATNSEEKLLKIRDFLQSINLAFVE
jgi:hypothetical protein